MIRRALLPLALIFSISAALALAALNLPQITQRVYDEANVIAEPTRTALTAKLKDLEDKSGIQLVVATVNSLQGYDIESYANALFRAAKLGDAKKNNGVLLLVAPNEHKARIEVGYGLEGVLTDAVSKIIITSAMTPRFKSGDFSGGVERGVDAIIDTLSSDQSEWTKRAAAQSDPLDEFAPFLLFMLFIFILLYMSRNSRGRGGGGPIIFIPPPGGGYRGGFSDGGWAEAEAADSATAAASRAGAVRRAAAAPRETGDADHKERLRPRRRGDPRR